VPKNLLLTRQWYESLAHLGVHIGDERFHSLLIAILKQITPFEHTVIIAYPDAARPIHVYNDLPEEQIKPSLELYFNGAYLLDPLYNACQNHLEEGYYRLRQLAPDEFYKSEYYHSYYQGTQLKEEVGLLVAVNPSLRVLVSMGIRDPDKTISNADLAYLDATWPLINALCRQHWKMLDLGIASDYRQGEEEHRLGEPLDLAFQNFGRDHLSERECEIVHLVLKGHSSKSIADLLSISADTVKAHRKHVHTKLQISSQAELFSLFLDAISLVPMGSIEDPLSLYYSQKAE
jgi:DNA-binding CsgD family transcriptional regulator